MRKCKFTGFESCGYVCVGYEIANEQTRYCKRKLTPDGKKALAKSFHSKDYKYPWVKLTSDGKALKHITLSAAQTRKIYNGLATVDDYVKKLERNRSKTIIKKSDVKERVNYCFCD